VIPAECGAPFYGSIIVCQRGSEKNGESLKENKYDYWSL